MNKKEHIVLQSTSLMVTERCTLKCKLCLSYAPYYVKPQVLTLSQAKATFAEYFRCVDRVEKFAITGGEPLTNPDIVAIMRDLFQYEKQISHDLIFITNGTVLMNSALIKLFLMKPEKLKIIINHYGDELSTKAYANYDLLCEAGLKTQVILYKEDNRYGWIDCRDHSLKHESVLERNQQAASCEFYKGKKYIIDRGELHSCTRSFYRILTGIVPKSDTEYIDLWDASVSVEEKRIRLQEMLLRPSSTACAYCSGLSPDTPKFPAAEQL